MSKKLKWNDVIQIVEELLDNNNFTRDQIMYIRFTDLQKLVVKLDNFEDLESNCNERVLEAIQGLLLEELE